MLLLERLSGTAQGLDLLVFLSLLFREQQEILQVYSYRRDAQKMLL